MHEPKPPAGNSCALSGSSWWFHPTSGARLASAANPDTCSWVASIPAAATASRLGASSPPHDISTNVLTPIALYALPLGIGACNHTAIGKNAGSDGGPAGHVL